ncbi:MAG: helix-turn-helix transcriptional regulator [Planctomycetaceae bacterium]
MAEEQYKVLLKEVLVSELRKLTGKTQKEVADALGIKQANVSKLENQSDMQISTLRRIINALGGELDMLVRLPDGSELIIELKGKSRKAVKKKKRLAAVKPVRV